MRNQNTTEAASAAAFRTTHWSAVLAAQQNETPEGGAALEQLCRTYLLGAAPRLFAPAGLHATRCAGHGSSLFASLLAREQFAAVDRSCGKFRSFLLAALKHFIANKRDRARALKRGGHCSFVPLNKAQAEEHFLAVQDLAPHGVPDQTWHLQ